MMQMAFDHFAGVGKMVPLSVPGARASDPETSHAAAESAKDMAVRQHQAIVLALKYHGAMGKDGIAKRLGMSGVAVARRLPELERLGKCAPTGKTVRSNSGRHEREWGAV